MTATPAIRITNTRTASASAFTVADIRRLIDGAPDDARFLAHQSGGGSQFDPMTTTLTVDMEPRSLPPRPSTTVRTEQTR